jgi:hypothetical protein
MLNGGPFSSGTPRGHCVLLAPISGLFEARTLPSRVARSSSGENAAPRWGAWPPEPPGAVPTCSLVVDSTHALGFCRGRCGRSLLGGTRLSTCVYILPRRDTASSVAHDVLALGARNDTFCVISASTAACFVHYAFLPEIRSDTKYLRSTPNSPD